MKHAPQASMPKGIIVAYYSSDGKAPVGWIVCDGAGGKTPDLRGMFILGATKWAEMNTATIPIQPQQPVPKPGQTGIQDIGGSLSQVAIPFAPPNQQTGAGTEHQHTIPAVILMYIMKT